MKFKPANLLILSGILFSLNSTAMSSEIFFENSDMLSLILHCFMVERIDNKDLIENNTNIYFGLQTDKKAKDERFNFINKTKAIFQNILYVNTFFYTATLPLLQKYVKVNITIREMIAFFANKYKFISYTPQFQNDAVAYFNAHKYFIDTNYTYKTKGGIVEHINTSFIDNVDQFPSKITLFYLRNSNSHAIREFVDEDRKRALLPFFTSCYDIHTKEHYHDICIKIQLILHEIFGLAQYSFLKKNIIDLCKNDQIIKKLYQHHALSRGYSPLQIAELSSLGILFCPVLTQFIEKNCPSSSLLMEDNELVPGRIIKQSISEKYPFRKVFHNLPLLNQYFNKDIPFEEFINKNHLH